MSPLQRTGQEWLKCHYAARNKGLPDKIHHSPGGAGTGLGASSVRLDVPLAVPAAAGVALWSSSTSGQLHGVQASGLKAALLKEA